jgi:hypothetical protein
MAFFKQIALLALAACSGVFLAGCQPSDPNSPRVAEIVSIAVAPNSVNLDVGGMQSLVVIGTFSDGTTRDVSFDSTFKSSASAVAAVSPTGLVSAVAPGTATITAAHAGSGKSATAQVAVAPLRVLSITLTPATSVLAPGATQQLLVTGRFNNATTGDVTAGSTFVSSSTAVATVGATGLVTAVATGTATITATHTASATTATATVEVTDAEFSRIDFDTPGVVYTLTGFGGAEDSTLVPDPTDGTNTVARVVKSATAELWAGTTVSTGPNMTVGRIPFTANDTRIAVRVYSPRSGAAVRLKVEDASDGTRSVETEATTTVTNGWETLTFDFANPVAGTAALNLAYTYNKISIFFDFGKSGAAGGGGTFYFDDLRFLSSSASGNTGTCSAPCIDFSSPDVEYAPFEGLVLAEQGDDPLDPSNKVAKFVKGPSGQPWAGATIYTSGDASLSVPAFDLSGSKVVTLRVYAPAAGLTVRLKLEDATNPAVVLEQDAVTTKANAWETLTFDFADPVGGSYDPASTYDRVSLFPAFLTVVPPASELTFYFDELQYTTVSGGGGSSGSTGTCAAPNCTDFSAAGITFAPFENQGGGTVEIANDPNDAGNKVVKFVKKVGDRDFFGTTISGLAGPAALTSTDRTVTLRVYSPAAGTNFLLKLENGPGGAVVEKDVATTVADAWETLSFDLSAGPAGTYATVVLFPNGRSTVTADKTMYVDELKFPAAATGGGPLVFASGFASNNLTVEGGEWGLYSGNFTDYANTYTGGGFVDQGVPAADSYVYLVITTSAPTTAGFMGIYTKAGSSAGVTLSGQTTLKLELGMAAEWFQQVDRKALTVRLIGAQVYSNGAGGECRILLDTPLTPTTADLTTYTINLSSMTLAQNCNGGGFTSGVSTVADALAKPIGELHVQAVFPQVNTTVPAGPEYPTGFTRGAAGFE